jgi:hypothetical protein
LSFEHSLRRSPWRWREITLGSAPWRHFKLLTRLGFPRSFPIVQFPNAPLIIAFAAGLLARVAQGLPHICASAVSFLAMSVWAYEEAFHGVNWFRHGLGFFFLTMMFIQLAGALHLWS